MLALMTPKLFQIHYEASLLPLFITVLSLFFLLISNASDLAYYLVLFRLMIASLTQAALFCYFWGRGGIIINKKCQ